MIGDIIAAIIGGSIENSVLSSMWKRNARIARDEGRVSSVVRVRLGEAPGLTTRWRRTEVRLSAGRMAFEGRRLTVIRGFRRSGSLRFRDAIAIPLPDPVIFDVDVDGASLEWAVPAEDADRVAQTLKPSPPRSG